MTASLQKNKKNGVRNNADVLQGTSWGHFLFCFVQFWQGLTFFMFQSVTESKKKKKKKVQGIENRGMDLSSILFKKRLIGGVLAPVEFLHTHGCLREDVPQRMLKNCF